MEYFSSWKSLKRAVAWLLRVKSMLLNCSKRKGKRSLTQTELEWDKAKHHALWGKNLTVDELQQVELAIIQYCQQRKFHKEIFALQRKESVSRGSHIIKLSPVLQDRILCCESMPVEAKHPAILRTKEIHKETGHSVRNYILSRLCQKFWIPNANSLIRRILSRCTTCCRQHGVTGQQMMADLPRSSSK